jgi:endoglucanase
VYHQLLALALKPVIIAEFGSGEFTKGDIDKATWIRQAFARMKAEYPWIKMYTWFNIKKELDWRVNSSPEALEAFRTAMADPYFLSDYQPAA